MVPPQFFVSGKPSDLGDTCTLSPRYHVPTNSARNSVCKRILKHFLIQTHTTVEVVAFGIVLAVLHTFGQGSYRCGWPRRPSHVPIKLRNKHFVVPVPVCEVL